MVGCEASKKQEMKSEKRTTQQEVTKTLIPGLPTIGIVIFDGFLTNEVVAPLDVFSKSNSDGKSLFNVILLAAEQRSYPSEEGLKVLPDYTLANSPELDVLVVPSSFHPEELVKDSMLINFVRSRGRQADYVASHCAGAFVLGESGLAKQKKIVTYVTGGTALQEKYPELNVMDDSKIDVVQDGNVFSSNGALVSYTASLDLLEEMTSKAHRMKVEADLLLDRLSTK